jgi:hypothetical protein
MSVLLVGVGAYIVSEALTPLFDGMARVAASVDNTVDSWKSKYNHWRNKEKKDKKKVPAHDRKSNRC